jgi:hypothetical protein
VLDQQAEDREAMLVCESSECRDGIYGFHEPTILRLTSKCQRPLISEPHLHAALLPVLIVSLPHFAVVRTDVAVLCGEPFGNGLSDVDGAVHAARAADRDG